MELRDAIDQITAIRTQLAATERLRSLRAVPVAFSGTVALFAAAMQSVWIPDATAQPDRWLALWIGAAAISALAAGMELLWRVRGSSSSLSVANATFAVLQFTPSIVAGASLTAFVAIREPGLLLLLPGLWQLLFGLGVLAAHRVLPRFAAAIGAGYLATGTVCLWLGSRALEPWAMGLPFAFGQFALAAILWWQQERRQTGSGTEVAR